MTGRLQDKRIAFIGGGIMGEAIIRGLLKGERLTPSQIIVSDPIAERCAALREMLGVESTSDNALAVRGADIVLLAVKPQVLRAVLAPLRGQIAPGTLIMTIVAGARIAQYVDALNTPAVVRVIPNTPGQVGEGVSLWTETPETTDEQREQAREILTALGVEVHGHNEDEVDMATALSGSGPAYVFLFIEALADAGVQMGLTREVASTLALHTVLGSAVYAREAGLHPAILRNRVTSPGGTTAAALYEFESGSMRATVTRAVLAAYHKAQQLGDAS
jgi:pyrroline-5-carboxylate reductase